jgi:hypothetical protein
VICFSKFTSLKNPAKYLPFCNRLYDVKPNLHRLGHDFGNDLADRNVLQIDNQVARYRQQKLRCRDSRFEKYYCNELLPNGNEETSIHAYLITTLNREYPNLFQVLRTPGEMTLSSRLTGENLRFDDNFAFRGVTKTGNDRPIQYSSGLDALTSQIQEDICVATITGDLDRLVAAHLSFPNQWSPTDKVGKNFDTIHHPVALFADQNTRPHSLIRALTRGGPYVRFAWGLSSDDDLDHHPDLCRTVQFCSSDDQLYVRVERQVTVFLESAELLLFFIRTYYYDCRELLKISTNRHALLASINSMKPATLEYKGLTGSKSAIVRWLENGKFD